MLDRMSLSMKNGWIDDENKVYIFFTLEDLQESLNCSHTTGVKILAELDVKNGIGLIERVKQGQGKPTRIYVKNFNLPSAGSPDFKKVEVKTSKNKKSRLPQNRSADFHNIDTNNINSNQNNYNDTENQSIHQRDMAKKLEVYREILHENIDYENLVNGHGVEKVNEYVQLMLDVICTTKATVRIDCADFPIEVVRSRFLNSER